MKLIDFNRVTRFAIDDSRMTTIVGVIFRHLDMLPRVGDKVTVDGINFEVLAMDDNRIARVRAGRTTDRGE